MHFNGHAAIHCQLFFIFIRVWRVWHTTLRGTSDLWLPREPWATAKNLSQAAVTFPFSSSEKSFQSDNSTIFFICCPTKTPTFHFSFGQLRQDFLKLLATCKLLHNSLFKAVFKDAMSTFLGSTIATLTLIYFQHRIQSAVISFSCGIVLRCRGCPKGVKGRGNFVHPPRRPIRNDTILKSNHSPPYYLYLRASSNILTFFIFLLEEHLVS